MAEIEQSTDRSGWTREKIQRKIRESREFWASTEGIAEARRVEQRKARAKGMGTKFPELARRSGTRPAAGPVEEVKDWSARFGI